MSFSNVSTRQTALANESEIATLTSDLATLSTNVNTYSLDAKVVYMMEGEGVAPIFSCSGIPFDDGFGIPMSNGCTIRRLTYQCATGSPLTTESMTLSLEVWREGSLNSTQDYTFTGNIDVNPMTINVIELDSIVIKYSSSFGTFPTDARFRIAMVTSVV
jgi:hypothetical protein